MGASVTHGSYDAVQLTVGTLPPPGAPPHPNVTELPAATVPLCAAFAAVTVEPVCV